MDLIMITAIAVTALAGMVVFALRPTEQPVRVRVQDRRK